MICLWWHSSQRRKAAGVAGLAALAEGGKWCQLLVVAAASFLAATTADPANSG